MISPDFLRFDEDGISIPFPQRDVQYYLYHDDLVGRLFTEKCGFSTPSAKKRAGSPSS
jgi:small-conductance mechanosensitive channel